MIEFQGVLMQHFSLSHFNLHSSVRALLKLEHSLFYNATSVLSRVIESLR